MIRKLSVILILLVVGLGVLHLTIGWENFARGTESDRDGEPFEHSSDANRGVVVGGANSSAGASVTARVGGAIEFRRRTARTMNNGDTRFLPVYELAAEDSEMIDEDLMRLETVRVEFYRLDDKAAEPSAVHIGTLDASEAFVQVGRDENGDASIREDRDMDLSEVEFRTNPTSAVGELELGVAALRARSSADGIAFRTPDPDLQFNLRMGGDEPMTLEGRGLRGSIPSEDSAARVLELHVESDPVLVHQRATLRARGALHYVENLASGFGRVELEDDVSVVGLGGAERDTRAAGDHLVARLVREESEERKEFGAFWRSIHLLGSDERRGTFTSGSMALECDELFVGPALDGSPYLFTATGNPRLVDSASGTVFTAEKKIHLIRLPRLFVSIEQTFDLPAVPSARLLDELVVFEGRSTVDDPTRGVSLSAEHGLRLLRSADKIDPPLMMVGYGQVQVQANDLTVGSSSGFTLAQRGDDLRLRLGPEIADETHEYRLEQRVGGDDAEGIVLVGHGLCTIVQRGEGQFSIDLESPRQDVRLDREGVTLSEVNTLAATIVDGDVRAFDAHGAACRIRYSLTEKDGTAREIEGVAQWIRTADGTSFEFSGSPDRHARLAQGESETVWGEHIEVHRRDDGETVLAAFGTPRGRLARVLAIVAEAEAEGARSSIRRIDLEADALYAVPHSELPADWLDLRGIPRLPPEAVIELAQETDDVRRSRYLLARGDVDLELIDEAGERVGRAQGLELYVRDVDRAGLLRGPGAAIEYEGSRARRIVAFAQLMLFAATSENDLDLTLVPVDGLDPVFETHDGGGELSSRFKDLLVECAGPITTTGGRSRFLGPVHARGLDSEGRIDPDGPDLEANRMQLVRSTSSGAIESISALGDTRLRMGRVHARGDEMTILVPHHLYDVVSRQGSASVVLDEFEWRGDQFRVDYESYEIRAWNSRLKLELGARVAARESSIGLPDRDR